MSRERIFCGGARRNALSSFPMRYMSPVPWRNIWRNINLIFAWTGILPTPYTAAVSNGNLRKAPGLPTKWRKHTAASTGKAMPSALKSSKTASWPEGFTGYAWENAFSERACSQRKKTAPKRHWLPSPGYYRKIIFFLSTVSFIQSIWRAWADGLFAGKNMTGCYRRGSECCLHALVLLNHSSAIIPILLRMMSATSLRLFWPAK